MKAAIGWSQSDPAIIGTSGRVRGGSWSAWLGGYNSADEQLAQTVTIPSGGATLRWAWQLSSSEAAGTRAYDSLHVRVHDSGGALLGTVLSRSNTSARDTWLAESANLGQWAGQTVSLRLAATTDASYASSFFRGRRQPGLTAAPRGTTTSRPPRCVRARSPSRSVRNDRGAAALRVRAEGWP